jgi:cell division protein DivIC
LRAVQKNVAKIQTDLTKQHDVSKMRAAGKRKRLLRRLAVFFVFACVAAFFTISTLVSQASMIEEKRLEKEKVKEELSELKKQERVLKEEIAKLNDREYIAKLARRDYFLSESDEIIFNIPEKKKEKKTEKRAY